MILCFDITDEAFQIIPIPDDLDIFWQSFLVWNDTLTLFSFSFEDSISIEIWVMADYFDSGKDAKVGCNWFKHVVIELLVVAFPLKFWKNDELLMTSKHGRLLSYNLHTKRLRTIGVIGSINLPVSSYEKSLVSLKDRGSS